MAAILQTLCLIYSPDQILLGMKKRGFGVNRWNGFGGKVRPGETIMEAAKREMFEEANIQILDLKFRGILTFEFEGQTDILEVHLFSSDKYLGEPKETEEMKPQWFKHNQIPFTDMWPDDPYWLPLVLEGKNVEGKFLFKDKDTILKHEIKSQSN
ncbi:MAG: 8-oxo-dGTP diphosphatase [Patescibacteria group bacterium]|jgi:8-oxo-dGTP diphosphatase/2-hydroxy-dATP diphosphatase